MAGQFQYLELTRILIEHKSEFSVWNIDVH